jgi:DNA-directed RNA polymerase
MAEKKFKYVPFVTEIMAARNPKLSEPDTKGEYADGKYKTEATADADYTERFQEEIQKAIEQNFAGKRTAHLPWKKTKDGCISFIFKSPKKKPVLVDAKGNLLKAGIIIYGGSLVRIAGIMAAWKKGSARGVNLWPDAVRVIELSESFDATSMFGPSELGFDGTKHPGR